MLRHVLARVFGGCMLLAASAVVAQADTVALMPSIPYGVVMPSGSSQSFYGVLNNTSGTVQVSFGVFAYSAEATTSTPGQFFTLTETFPSQFTLLPGESRVVPLFDLSVAPGLTQGYIRGPFIVFQSDPVGGPSIRLGQSLEILINLNREVISSVPEPATLFLFGSGLAGATALARRRGRRG